MNVQLDEASQGILNNPLVVYVQLAQLTDMAGDDAIEALAYCMRDGDERLREMAASYFFAIVREESVKNTSSVPIIIEAVEKEDNPLAKRDMIAALGTLGDKRAFDTILKA